jgi:hypothetical protein
VTPTQGVRAAAVAFAITTVCTSIVSVRERLDGRPLGVRIGVSVPRGLLLGWGSAVAAPWPMPVGALLLATRVDRGDRGAHAALGCAAIGIAGVVGLLLEPNTYGVRAHSRDNRLAIVAGFATTGVLAVTGLRRWHESAAGGG